MEARFSDVAEEHLKPELCWTAYSPDRGPVIGSTCRRRVQAERLLKCAGAQLIVPAYLVVEPQAFWHARDQQECALETGVRYAGSALLEGFHGRSVRG